jgi:NADPH2:quinone reductase
VFWGAWVGKNPKRHQQSVAELLDMYAAGKIKPYVSEHFPFDKAPDAISHLASRKAMGKVVITLD